MNVCPVLVGRDVEMHRLLDALERGGLVLIAGEAGIGKSRLVREFADLVREQGHAVAWGRAEAVTSPGPYSLVLDLLDDLAVRARDDAEARELATMLERLEAGAEPPARQVAARIRGILSRLGARPVVIIEDLHFADELSQAVLVHLARSAADDGTVVVGSYRTEEAMRGSLARVLDLVTRDRIAMQIELRPLDRAAIVAMVEAMWDEAPAVDEVETLVKLGEGIPFFIEELAAARDQGVGSVPASISRAVATRMQRLDRAGERVVTAASLMSGAIDPGVLADVCDVPEHDVPKHLIDAVRAGLLTDDDSHLVFRHALVRSSIAESVVSVERVALHARLAEAIEGRYGTDSDVHAAALARHWIEAGDGGRAARYAAMAGRRALAAGALDEAREAFTSVVGLKPDPALALEARAGLAEVAIRARAWEQAQEEFAAVISGYDALGMVRDAARARLRLAWLKQLVQDRAALDVIDEALASLPDQEDDRLYAELLIEKGYWLVRSFSDPVEAVPLLEEGLARAEKLDDAQLRALAHEGLGWVAEFDGDVTASDEHAEHACRLALGSGDIEMIGRTFSNRALRLAVHGRGEEALATLDEVTPATTSLLTQHRQSMEHARVWILWRLGRPAEAERAASALQATRWASWYARLAQVWSAAERGDMEGCERTLNAWWAEFGDPSEREHLIDQPAEGGPAAIVGLAELIVRIHARSEVDDRTREAARAYLASCEGAAPDVWLLVALLVVRADVRAGDLDAAEELLGRCEELLTRAPCPLQEATAWELRGAVAMRRERPPESAAAFARAAEVFKACDNFSDRARCMRLHAEALAGSGAERDEVASVLREAREIAVGAGALAEANRCESVLRSLGIRPRAGRPKGSGRPKGTLSPREAEVAALVAAGASNAEIAARLFLSERTVQDHITGALRRLSLSGRAALAAWAAKQGLV